MRWSALSRYRFCLAALIWCGVFAPAREARAQIAEHITIRGHAQNLRLYGSRGGTPVIVSSGDGGWIHLGPHVAEVLAANGFFVVGFDAKASWRASRLEKSPCDLKTNRATTRCSLIMPAGIDSTTDSDWCLRGRRVIGPGSNRSSDEELNRGRYRIGSSRPE